MLVTRRVKYLLEGEEVTMKFQYVEGKPSEMKIELFSIEHGAYGTLFENINMEDIVAQLPQATLSLKDEVSCNTHSQLITERRKWYWKWDPMDYCPLFWISMRWFRK